MPHDAMTELCTAAEFKGQVPEALTRETVMMVLESTETMLDHDGKLYWVDGPAKIVTLTHGERLLSLISEE